MSEGGQVREARAGEAMGGGGGGGGGFREERQEKTLVLVQMFPQ